MKISEVTDAELTEAVALKECFCNETIILKSALADCQKRLEFFFFR